LYRHALMILGDTAMAEDVVHQVFVRLLRGGRSTEPVRSTRAYLRQAVRNECFSWLRRRESVPGVREDASPQLAPSGPAPQDDQVILEQALGTLPPDQREVVHLKVFEGFTFAEIADPTGVSINTAASRYRYALDKLAASLGGARERPDRTA
jgi:RNA polymerase sigma-70 factor (ECF subfamily)